MLAVENFESNLIVLSKVLALKAEIREIRQIGWCSRLPRSLPMQIPKLCRQFWVRIREIQDFENEPFVHSKLLTLSAEIQEIQKACCSRGLPGSLPTQDPERQEPLAVRNQEIQAP
jgi:hypothetical protein